MVFDELINASQAKRRVAQRGMIGFVALGGHPVDAWELRTPKTREILLISVYGQNKVCQYCVGVLFRTNNSVSALY